MKNEKTKDLYACDFETTVYSGQDHTEVWSSAICKIGTEDDAIVHHSIDETMSYWERIGNDVIGYYHNLKFDGTFIVSWLFNHGYSWEKDKNKLLPHEFTTLISDMGMWYTININTGKINIELRDSLKLVPFSLKQCGKAFKTKHQKLDMEYTGYRYSGCPISDEEMEYIKNDVYVLREVLEFMFEQGHKSLTIGSCCMYEYRGTLCSDEFKMNFPDLTKITLEECYGSSTADEYIRKSYRGGWCYVVPEKTNKVFRNGVTADVNSLYPSMMHSESGNYYPVGAPVFWKGNYIPEKANNKTKRYYFIRFKCSFRIKPNYLPFIQIKGNPLYKATEMLTDSRPSLGGVKYDSITVDGIEHTNIVTMTMTCTDWELFQRHYYINDL